MIAPCRHRAELLAALLGTLACGSRHSPTLAPNVAAGAGRSIALRATITPGQSLQSDGNPTYRGGEPGVNAFAAFALTLCIGAANRCTTYPEAGSPAPGPRAIGLDLTRPVPGSRATSRGIVRPPQANLGAFWGQDTTQRTTYGGIEGWVLKHTLHVPIGTTVQSERVELRFLLDGRQYILQMGPWVAGQYQRGQGKLSGEGTTEATIQRLSPTAWLVVATPGSTARLWDNTNPAAPQDLGLYYFSFEVRFDAS